MRIRPLLLSAAIMLAGTRSVFSQPAPAGLTGYVELHAHPLSNVGFGGKLVYGGPDIGSLLPADPDCNSKVRATSMQQALGHDRSTHGGWAPFKNPCGDSIREQVIHIVQKANNAADENSDAHGFPEFTDWPVWNDLTHQKMWIDWIKRAYDDGLRVMVALSVNNKTLADAVCGPCDGPTDDKASADLQIAEIKGLVSRHNEFMEIALTADDLARINKANKLAVVLGMEVDNFGNFNLLGTPPSDAQIKAEIDRLFAEGVRYMFPVHLLDNKFGGTATYVDLFNFSTEREDGHYWDMGCDDTPASQGEEINYQFAPFAPALIDLLNAITRVKLKTTFPPLPAYPVCGSQLSVDHPTLTVAVPPGQPSVMINTLKITLINGGIALDSGDTVTVTLQLRDGTSLPAITLKAAGDPAWTDNPPKLSPIILSPSVDISTIAQVTVTLGTTKPNNCSALQNIGISTFGIIQPPSCLVLQDFTVVVSNDAGLANPAGRFETALARSASGLVNKAGLNDRGVAVLKEIMRHGMFIDIDHMSDKSKKEAFEIAFKVPGGGYPLNSGHSSPRGFFASRSSRKPSDVNERSTSLLQYEAIARLHGMAGLGTGNSDAWQLVEMYKKVIDIMQPLQPSVSAGIGTDTDGFAPGMPPRCDPPIDTETANDTCFLPDEKTTQLNPKRSLSHVLYDTPDHSVNFPISKVGSFPVDSNGKVGWDYNKVGVVHYGMLADFRKDMATAPNGPTVIANMNKGAEYFYETWKICEDRKNKVD
jgi:Membrane dipeptidase (Peptidase family M19)